jgi:hypothetical protein
VMQQLAETLRQKYVASTISTRKILRKQSSLASNQKNYKDYRMFIVYIF